MVTNLLETKKSKQDDGIQVDQSKVDAPTKNQFELRLESNIMFLKDDPVVTNSNELKNLYMFTTTGDEHESEDSL